MTTKSNDVNPLDAEPIARRSMTVFYLIDTSGSMAGEKIGIVNNTMTETIPAMRNVGGADSEVRVAVLTFDTQVNWMYSKPESIETFKWKDVTADGMTSMGTAFQELSKKMSRQEFLQSAHLSFAPAVIMLSDGEPNDDFDGGLSTLKKNKWFQHSIKVAVAIGADADRDKLAEFTGSTESVITVHNGDDLAKVLKFVSMTSSEIGSSSIGFDSDSNAPGITAEEASNAKQDAVNQQIKQMQNSIQPKDIDFQDGW